MAMLIAWLHPEVGAMLKIAGELVNAATLGTPDHSHPDCWASRPMRHMIDAGTQ
jgi:hypothetical protein